MRRYPSSVAPAGTPGLAAVTSSHFSDVRITDEALEAAFVEGSVRSAQRGRHRYGTLWSLICLAAFLASVQLEVLRKNVLGSPSALVRTGGWLYVAGFAAWLLTTCVGGRLLCQANSYSLEAYSTRMRWYSTIGYCGCLVAVCGTHLDPMVGSRDALHLAGWVVCVLNVAFSGFFCFGSAPRTQAAAVALSWILGVGAAAVTSPTSTSARDFLVLHTSSCIGVMIAYVLLGTSQRQGFLYTSILVAEVQSEREQKAEARAVGEQAVCAWVCHEIRNPLNALQFCVEELIKDNNSVITHAGTMQQCNRHILSVITNMLDLSKLAEGKMVIKKETFDLGECMCSIESICRWDEIEGICTSFLFAHNHKHPPFLSVGMLVNSSATVVLLICPILPRLLK
jgi:hypothetical protein